MGVEFTRSPSRKDITGTGSADALREVFAIGNVGGVQNYQRAVVSTPPPPFPNKPPKLIPRPKKPR